MALPLSPQVFAILAALVEERAGLHYGPNDRELFAEKVSARAIDRGFDSLLDYYYFLRYDAGSKAELDDLVAALVVHESYFFREREQLEWLVDDFLAPRAGSGRKLRVWSAACAGGEEPLTLVMLLHDRRLADAVEVVASDVSERALERARGGVFSPRALRHNARPELVTRWLAERDGRIVAARALVDAVRWRRVNLIDAAEVAALGRFDAIVCRNVLIYFSDTTTRRVVEALTGQLVDDGVLLVGVSESLLRSGTAVACEEHGGVFVYRPVRT